MADDEDMRRVGANQYDLGSFNEAVIIETIRGRGRVDDLPRRVHTTGQWIQSGA